MAGFGCQKLNINEPIDLIIGDNRERIVELLVEDGNSDKDTLENDNSITLLEKALKTNNLGLLKELKEFFHGFLSVTFTSSLTEYDFQRHMVSNLMIIQGHEGKDKILNRREYLDENISNTYVIKGEYFEPIYLEIEELINDNLIIDKLAKLKSIQVEMADGGNGPLEFMVDSPYKYLTLNHNAHEDTLIKIVEEDPFSAPFLIVKYDEPAFLEPLMLIALRSLQDWYQDVLEEWNFEQIPHAGVTEERLRMVSILEWIPSFMKKRKDFFIRCSEIDACTIVHADESLCKDPLIGLELIGKPNCRVSA